jgi:Ca2+ transporting ATPase
MTFIPHSETQDLFVNSICANSVADPNIMLGTASELALVRYLSNVGVDVVTIRQSHQFIALNPFSSKRKRTSVVVEDKKSKTGMYTYLKGASEYVTDSCNTIRNLNTGKVSPIDETMREKINNGIIKMARTGLRTIAVAYKEQDGSYKKSVADDRGILDYETSGFTLLGIYGIQDVLRPGVKKAIEDCKKAGVRVRMVTGDNIVTARAIARACGIISDSPDSNDLIMEGPEFMEQIGGLVERDEEPKLAGLEGEIQEEEQEADRKVVKNKNKFIEIASRLQVLARSRPEDKHALVTGLRQVGQVVAVTGDGTNDAPALAKADVGFAMGIAGTEVAKSACDIMIMDDNFCSIVQAIVWGRNVYDSIRKFLQFQLTVNVVAVVAVFIGAVILRQAVVNAVMMLWLNLIMDTLASLALATEEPNGPELLKRKPYMRDDYIISKKMFKHITGHSFVQLIVTMWLVFQGDKFLPWNRDDGQANEDGTVISGRYFFVRTGEPDYVELESELGPSAHFTYVFNIFVWMQIFNFMNARKINDEINILEGLGRSQIFCGIMAIICVLQILIITFGSRAIGCVQGGFDREAWTISIVVGAISLPVGLVMKMLSEELLCPCKWGAVETDPFKGYANSAVGMKRTGSSIRRMSTNKLSKSKKLSLKR